MHDALPPLGSRSLRVVLWLVAVLVTLAALVWQRTTGPTYPLRVEYALGERVETAALNRSGTTGEGAKVEIPAPPAGFDGRLHWKRYPTADAFEALPLARVDNRLEGRLPEQPAAGKLEYYLELTDGTTTVRVPATEAANPILRYKNAVPAFVLIPHILVVFLAMLLGLRAGLAALAGLAETRRLAFFALGLVTLGSLVFGPILQKIAFGAFWTGWPLGHDLTDNKALAAWLAWLIACIVIGRRPGRRERAGRVAVILATLVMLVVFSIPHSLRGSELDYRQLEDGVAPEDAIKTG